VPHVSLSPDELQLADHRVGVLQREGQLLTLLHIHTHRGLVTGVCRAAVKGVDLEAPPVLGRAHALCYKADAHQINHLPMTGHHLLCMDLAAELLCVYSNDRAAASD
jgi:hypothetical protein